MFMGIFSLDSPLMRFLNRVADLLILNVTFIVCCIPVFTIGPALSALYTVSLKLADNKEGYIFKGFLKAFRENFKKGLILGLIMTAIALVLGLDYWLLAHATGSLTGPYKMIITASLMIYLMILPYVFSLQARFENKITATFKNAVLLAVAYFPYTLLMLLIIGAAIVVTFWNTTAFLEASIVWMLLGFALIAYVNSFLLERVFAKYIPEETEEGPAEDLISEQEETEK